MFWCVPCFGTYRSQPSFQNAKASYFDLVRLWKQKPSGRAKTLTTHIVAAILCFFFVRYNYPVELFADILHIFTIKSDTCFSDCFFHLELFDFLHGLKAEKQNVGNNRTDSFSLCDGNRSKTNTGAVNFHHSFTKFVTPYLECTRTLHQNIKTVFIKNGLLLKCSLGKIYQL